MIERTPNLTKIFYQNYKKSQYRTVNVENIHLLMDKNYSLENYIFIYKQKQPFSKYIFFDLMTIKSFSFLIFYYINLYLVLLILKNTRV